MKLSYRIKKFRRSPAYNTFVGVLLALIVFELLQRLI